MTKRILFAIILFCLHNNLWAQASGSMPFFTAWYEYGDGKFINTSFPTPAQVDNFFAPSTSNLPPYSATGTYRGIQRYVGHYKPPTKPSAKEFAYRPTANNSSGGYSTMAMPPGRYLNTNTSTKDFLSNDTLMLALQYNTNIASSPSYNATKMYFFYNSNPDPCFVAISNPAEVHAMPNAQAGTVLNVPQIRMHNGETVTVATAAELSSIGNGSFTNGLVFNLQARTRAASAAFVTMFTLANIRTDDNEEFELVFTDKNNQPLERTRNDVINHSKLKSHDPNYEKVQPECVLFPTDAGKIMQYQVHFQNTGPGPAHDVITYTFLPAGYTAADIVGYPNFNWAIGGTAGHTMYDVTVRDSSNALILTFRQKLDASGMPMIAMILEGTATAPDPANNVSTMGDFDFQMRLKSPLGGPSNLKSYTDIYFDDNDKVVTNDAVIRVRRCCDCTNAQGGTPRDTKPDIKDCKWRSKFLQWLLCKDC
jgi:hypothetical protein